MKLKLAVVFFVSFSLFLPVLVFGQSRNEGIAAFISSVFTNKQFTTAPVDNADVDIILQCGIKAPSARNGQPWHFTVIRDVRIMKEIIPDALEGNVLIVVSGPERLQGSIFDCGLATENVFLAAQALGLGSHIYTGPIAKLNQDYRDAVGMPDGYIGVSIIKIGNIEQGVDSVSSASTRKPGSGMVNYR